MANGSKLASPCRRVYNDKANVSWALSVDGEGTGVVRIVSRYTLALRLACNTSRGPVFPPVTGCDQAGFTFARSAGARGDQNAVSPPDDMYRNIERGSIRTTR